MPADPPPAWVILALQRLGHRVRQLRAARGLTQEQLAHAAGLDRKTVNRIERALVSTPIDKVLMVARGLGVPMAALFPLPQPPPEDEPPPPPSAV